VTSAPGDEARDLELADEAATRALASRLAQVSRIGDVIALHGDLGTGKTSFARGFIAALGEGEEVPSPTFTLVQSYETRHGLVAHFDLYRLARPEDAEELGLDEALGEAIVLIEWPERLGDWLPRERLDLELRFGSTPQARRARLRGSPSWRERLAAMPGDG
jgi:tRNA threonylcarbamoyladenosine biosynthesis protein TsaE